MFMTWSYDLILEYSLCIECMMMWVFTYTFSCTLAADYSVNYTVSESNGIADELVNNATTRELRMSTGIAELILTFSIAQDGIDEDPEDFFLFLEGTRRIFVLCPVGSVTIIDRIRKCQLMCARVSLY